MTDESGYLSDFFAKVCTSSTVKNWVDTTSIHTEKFAGATRRIFIDAGEFISFDTEQYTKLHTVTIQEPSEANMTTDINAIILGLFKLITGQTITSYTKPSTLCFLKLRTGGKMEKKESRYYYTLQLLARWSYA